jgi:hypothetical protein
MKGKDNNESTRTGDDDRHHKERDEFDLPNAPKDDGSESHNESPLFILKQLTSFLKLSGKVSSKVLTPALIQMFQTSAPALSYYYKQLTPARIKEWIQIVTSALQNLINIVSQTPRGKELLSQFNTVSVHNAHLLTSVNTRQLIVEGVGTHVKLIDALRTPQTKAFIASLPVFSIRILDLLASGEAKLLYHSMAELAWKTIDLLGQDETTLALAEFAALLVNALEKERECHGSWSRNRRRGRRRIKLAPLERRNAASLNSKRRRERNAFMKQTYTDRVMLNDTRRGSWDGSAGSVEDAILSSLGDGTRSNDNNPNAWLNFNVRSDSSHGADDGASLPSKVVLPRIGSRGEISVDSMQLDDLEITPENGDDENRADGEKYVAGGFNVSRLRDGINMRGSGSGMAEKILAKDMANRINSKRLPSVFVAEDGVNWVHDDFKGSGAIEDLVFNTDFSKDSPQKSPSRPSEMNQTTKENLAHEDFNVDAPIQEEVARVKTRSRGRMDGEAPRGTYSSVAHFYRALEDFQTRLRDETSASAPVPKTPMPHHEEPGVSSTSKYDRNQVQSRAAVAPVNENENGQNIPRHNEDMKGVTLLDVVKFCMKAIPRKHKIAAGVIAITCMIITLIWIFLGCCGLYFILTRTHTHQQSFGHQFEHVATLAETAVKQQPAQNEIILRIIQDASVSKIIDKEKIVTAATDAIRDELHYENILIEL